MAGKVIHVSDDVHAKVKAFCARHDVSPKKWIEALALRAIETGIFDPQKVVVGQLASPKIEPSADTAVIKKLREEIKSIRFKLDREKEKHQPVLAQVERKTVVQNPKAEDDDSIYNQPAFWESGNGKTADGESGDRDEGGDVGAPVRDARDIPGHA